MLKQVLDNRLIREVAERLSGAPGGCVTLNGVWGSSPALLAACMGKKTGRTVLLVSHHLDDADAAADDIEIFLSTLGGAEARVHQFPAWETQLSYDTVSEEITGERLRLLDLLAAPQTADEEVRFIVAPIMALLQPVPTKEALAAGHLKLRSGEEMSIDSLMAWLTDGGYEHVDQVDQQGQCAHRGGIVDVFPPGVQTALRVEFWGDTIESIRKFDLDTQRSTEPLQAFDIPSMTVGQCRADSGFNATNFLEYLPADTIITFQEPSELRDLADQLYDRVRDDLVDESSPVALRKVGEVFDAMCGFTRAEMHLFAGKTQPDSVRLGVRSLERLSINTGEALGELEEIAAVNDVWIFCENDAERQRLTETLDEHYPVLTKKVNFGKGHISTGFHWPEANIAVVGHAEIYQRYSRIRRIRRVRTGRPIESMLDLNEGDYVVHVAHGIAKFEGLRKHEKDETGEEHLKLKFANGAVLNVPTSQINFVQKYIGAKGHRPTLSTLGGTQWAKSKERVTQAVDDLAAEMLRLHAMREAMPGTVYPKDTQLQRQFAEEFLYTETDDQLSSILQVDADMSLARPMDRLICGDVGYGKTEIAMRAAFKAVEAKRQVAVLVPTTVLADQHFRTFRERFADFPVNIEVISRFRTAKQQNEIIKRLQLGQVDVLIGTHRLLSKDVKFPDLGLVVIDEEQRFGVASKEHLKSLRATVDVLTLSATPIPRTLHMALLGLRDISSLQTPPMDRRAIHTEVCTYDEGLIKTAIHRELNREGQIYIIHNRVQDIDMFANRIRTLAGDAEIAIAHGQMPERALEKIMLRFSRGEIDILICTTIVESGVDIPTANTMIIHDADRFGLAELHQLRGRVGRYKHRAYCYLLLPQERSLTPIAARRLKAIEDFSDLGAGFQIAMRDLEIRGAGNILGAQQSGHIATVGYEMYCRMLENSVNRLKGKPATHDIDVQIDIGCDAYIPRSYIPSSRQRMEIYRRLAACRTIEEAMRLRDDLDDAFGHVPPAMEMLLDIVHIRILSAQAGIRSMMLMHNDIIFRADKPAMCEKIFNDVVGTVRLVDNNTFHWRPPQAYLEVGTLLRVLKKRLAAGPGRAEPPAPPKPEETPKMQSSTLVDPPPPRGMRRRKRL